MAQIISQSWTQEKDSLHSVEIPTGSCWHSVDLLEKTIPECIVTDHACALGIKRVKTTENCQNCHDMHVWHFM